MTKQSEVIDLAEIVTGLPSRMHHVADGHVAESPDRVALIEDGSSWTYRELDRSVKEIAAVLAWLGVRPGDRVIIVSENCIALAALLLAASRIDAWAIVANPRLSARELDQIRDHSGARRMFFTAAVSKEAAAHASRCDAEVRQLVVRLDGGMVPNGEIGELHVRGRNVMRGYYRAPELTAKAIDADGWFNTGDLARFDGDCLYIVGRSKEMIIRSGFNVYPAEVEAVLNSHAAVVQSAVVGRAVEGNEEVVAFVQLMRGSPVKSAELMAFINPQLTSYKRPSEIIVLDALPATSTGKILKHKLAESLRGA